MTKRNTKRQELDTPLPLKLLIYTSGAILWVVIAIALVKLGVYIWYL